MPNIFLTALFPIHFRFCTHSGYFVFYSCCTVWMIYCILSNPRPFDRFWFLLQLFKEKKEKKRYIMVCMLLCPTWDRVEEKGQYNMVGEELMFYYINFRARRVRDNKKKKENQFYHAGNVAVFLYFILGFIFINNRIYYIQLDYKVDNNVN